MIFIFKLGPLKDSTEILNCLWIV